MALHSLLMPDNKIKEIEENNAISPPSLSFIDKKTKTVSNLSFSKFKNELFQNSLIIKKSKSYRTLSIGHNLYDKFFGLNALKTNLTDELEINNININKEKSLNNKMNSEKNINNNYNNIINKENNYFKIYKPDSDRLKNVNIKIFQNLNNKIDINSLYFNSNSEESGEKSNINVYNRFRNKKVFKKNLYKPNMVYNNKIIKREKILINNKMAPYIDKINNNDINENNIKENQSQRNKTKMNMGNLTKTSSFFYQKNNSLTSMKAKPYIKKKIEHSKISESFNKKSDNNSLSEINFLKRYSLQQPIIQNKKNPLILNINMKKNCGSPILKLSQFQKILKYDGMIYILRFLDYYDIINLFKTKNRKMYILLNTALANTYYFRIEHYLFKYNYFFELLKCNIVKTQIKDSLKIDLIINLRFKISKYRYMIINNKIEKTKISFIEPLYFQFLYLYNYFQKVMPEKELITKEEIEKQNKSKKLKMYDCYTFDLYPENYFDDNNIKNNSIFITKELPIKERDNNNLANVQPLLPFIVNDKGIINLELYTSDNGFIDPDSIKIMVKVFNLKNSLKMLYDKNISNPRISEYEGLCGHWKNVNKEEHINIIKMVKMAFNPYFIITNMYYENIGVFTYKVCLKAIKSGEINDKKKIGIKIKIKEKKEYIENEIRKNNLLFERRDVFEIRVGDELIYYFCTK